MPPVAIVTLIAVGVLVAALAFYLIRVALILRSVIDTLGKVTFGVRAIAHQTAPVNDLVQQIAADIATMEGALEDLLESKQSPATEAEVAS